ncbi:hypothetical protein [uncultured Megasphaera sp.]|uniref:hypothetical protein n=1 Tax=uncultured Megasphaera sp. TaxID=165188 RepID=UPI0025EEB126|nr:hypothetical protein [uncultured Megasphaera sp.]
MDMAETMHRFLMDCGKKTILLEQMQTWFPKGEYDDFRLAVLQLMQEGCLEAVRNSGTDYGGLPRKFRINRGALFQSAEVIQRDAIRHALSARMNLRYYYEQPLPVWQEDFPYICRLSDWMKTGVARAVSLQQRSWDIFHDEKYLTGPGMTLLHRLKLSLSDLKIKEEPDPLMMAVNPATSARTVFHHLVVENKAPYYALVPFLRGSGFFSLVFGAGWKITANLKELPRQTGHADARHVVWYFGDFNWEGLRIWLGASESASDNLFVQLAVPFYQAYLHHEAPSGKENQQADEIVLESFVQTVGEPAGLRFRNILVHQRYYPQEALAQDELLQAWEELAYGAGTFR